MLEDQYRHPLITRTILILLPWLTLQRSDLELCIMTLTKSGVDLLTTCMCHVVIVIGSEPYKVKYSIVRSVQAVLVAKEILNPNYSVSVRSKWTHMGSEAQRSQVHRNNNV